MLKTGTVDFPVPPPADGTVVVAGAVVVVLVVAGAVVVVDGEDVVDVLAPLLKPAAKKVPVMPDTS